MTNCLEACIYQKELTNQSKCPDCGGRVTRRDYATMTSFTCNSCPWEYDRDKPVLGYDFNYTEDE